MSIKDVKTKNLPKGSALFPQNERFRDGMHEIFDELREHAPILVDDELKRFVVTKANYIREIFHNKTVCVRNWQKYANEDTFAWKMGQQIGSLGLLDMDGQEHHRQRSLLYKAFNPREIECFRQRIESIVDEIIANVKHKTQFDFIAEFSYLLPTRVMAYVLGIEEGQHKQFKEWSDQLVQSVDPAIDEEGMKKVFAAHLAVGEYFKQMIADRRKNPQDDFMTNLINAHEQEMGDLTVEEIITTCVIFIVAGNVTTTDLLGNGMVALLQNPDQFEKLKNNLNLMPQAIEEMLRYDSPATEVPRVCAETTEIDGITIPKGETLSLMIAAANRDPEVFSCPHMFNVERKEGKHYAFGGGIHLCLGAPLARLEAEIAFKKILEAFPNMTLCPHSSLKRKSVPTLNGYETVIVYPNL